MCVCEKHRSAPAIIYGGCAGCEIEGLRARAAELEAQTPSALKAKLESAEARIAELEALHRTYYNQPFAEACQRAASEERERCIDRALAWWAITPDLDAIPTDVAAEGIRAALEGRHPDLDLNPQP